MTTATATSPAQTVATRLLEKLGHDFKVMIHNDESFRLTWMPKSPEMLSAPEPLFHLEIELVDEGDGELWCSSDWISLVDPLSSHLLNAAICSMANYVELMAQELVEAL